MKNSLLPYGCKYCEDYNFSCGHTVPIYEVSSVHSLNQLIGYAKFINKSFGDVYYRGECKLHDSLLPSLFRGKTNISSPASRLNTLIQNIMSDSNMKKQLKLDTSDSISCQLKIEGLLQHYGIKTRFVDVVDNHWVALMQNTYEINRTVKNDTSVETLYIVDGKKVVVKSIFGTRPYADVLREIIHLKTTNEKLA